MTDSTPTKLVPMDRSRYPATCPVCSGKIAQGAPCYYAPGGRRNRKIFCPPCGDKLTGQPAGSLVPQAAALPPEALQPVGSIEIATPQPVPLTPQAAQDPGAIAAAIAKALAESGVLAPQPAQVLSAGVDPDAVRAIARQVLSESLRKVRRAGVQPGPEPVLSVPTVCPDYFHGTSTGKSLAACLGSASHCWVSGPSGSGKTYPALQEAARQGLPVLYVGCSEGMDRSGIVGTWVLEPSKSGQPTMRPQYGALPRAMAAGAVLVLDEADKLPPALSAVLLSVTEPGKPMPLEIPEFGVSIEPAPGFAVVCTGNTLRDSTGLYSGQRPDMALVTRLLHVPANWLGLTEERKILCRHAPDKAAADAIARTLKALRPKHESGQVDTPPSLRTGVTVAKLLCGLMPSGLPAPGPFDWLEAWSLALLGSLGAEQLAVALPLVEDNSPAALAAKAGSK